MCLLQKHLNHYKRRPMIVTIFMSIPMFLGISNPMVPIKMWMSHMYFEINDKTPFLTRFRSRKYEKTQMQTNICVALFSLYYDKQYIVDGF